MKDGQRTEFTYDGQSRWTRIVEKDGPTTAAPVLGSRRFVWEGYRIAQIREYDASDTLTGVRHLFDEGEVRSDSLNPQPSSINLLHLRDHLGSVRELVNATDLAMRARYDFDPYGQRTKLDGDMDADFGFTGHYEHQAGLTLPPFRAYHSGLGRWLSRDPIGEEGGINLYSYLESEPIQRVDLLGLMPSAKIGGNKVQVHRNDVDPWPSSPHGHIYDKNQVVDVHGNIYNKSTGKVVGHIGKKNLARLTQLFQKVGRRGGVVSIAFFLADASAQGAHVAATTALRSAFFLDEIAYIRNRLRGDVPGDPDDDGDGIPDLNDPDHPRYWDDIEFECRTTGRKTK